MKRLTLLPLTCRKCTGSADWPLSEAEAYLHPIMNLDEVPQDGLDYKERDKLRKLMYATDKDGHYTGIPSVGWEAENIATKGAWDEMTETLRETEAAVRAGKLSPIAYFMQQSLMDEALLAKYVGKWKWTVKRHMKPAVFAKLNDAVLSQYASVFNITLSELKSFGKA